MITIGYIHPLFTQLLFVKYNSFTHTVMPTQPFRNCIINPRRMREGYGSCSVCVCVSMSVTELPATYLVYKSQVCYCMVPCGV